MRIIRHSFLVSKMNYTTKNSFQNMNNITKTVYLLHKTALIIFSEKSNLADIEDDNFKEQSFVQIHSKELK